MWNAFLATEPGFGPKKNTALTGGRSFTIEDAIETAYIHLHNGRSGLHERPLCPMEHRN